MSQILILFAALVLTTAGCAKNDPGQAYQPSQADANTLTTLEQQAVQAGVSIRHGRLEYSSRYSGTITPLSISFGGVGTTEDEIKAAIQVLRNYHAAVSSSTSITNVEDRKQQLDVIDDAMVDLQAKRTDILTKKMCGK